MKTNLEFRYATELADALDARGGIITKGDRRLILQAFERHYREVQIATLSKATAKLRRAIRR